MQRTLRAARRTGDPETNFAQARTSAGRSPRRPHSALTESPIKPTSLSCRPERWRSNRGGNSLGKRPGPILTIRTTAGISERGASLFRNALSGGAGILKPERRGSDARDNKDAHDDKGGPDRDLDGWGKHGTPRPQ